MTALARIENGPRIEVLAFHYSDMTTAAKVRAKDALAGRIFHLPTTSPLSERVMAQYLTICVRDKRLDLEEGEVIDSRMLEGHFDSHPAQRTEALCRAVKDLRTSLVKEKPLRHIMTLISTKDCYFRVVTAEAKTASDSKSFK